MKTFSTIEKELGLKKFLSSDNGTFIPPPYVDNYVDIIRRWQIVVNEIDALGKIITIELPFEVG